MRFAHQLEYQITPLLLAMLILHVTARPAAVLVGQTSFVAGLSYNQLAVFREKSARFKTTPPGFWIRE